MVRDVTGSSLRGDDPRQLGEYELISKLGEGGMGTVYLAQDRRGRRVAVKVIRRELSSNPEFRSRFRREVLRARDVPPFCTAEVLHADPDHETPFLVVEYVDGPSLADVVRGRGPLGNGELHSVAVGVATALAAIHGAGVVHRDLKPANVLFGLGTPKVIDFGIAKTFEATSEHTVAGKLLGTVAYMAPERFDADTARCVGPPADVFAWGVLVTYAATGHTPFSGDSPLATVGCIVTQPPDLTGLTGPLRDLVARALDKNPARRPTAHELVDILLNAGCGGNRAVRAGLDRRTEVRQAAEAMRRKASYRGRHGAATNPSANVASAVVDAVRGRRSWTRRRTVALVVLLAVFGGLVNPQFSTLTGSLLDRSPGSSSQATDDAVLIDLFDRSHEWKASRNDTRGNCTVGGSLTVTRKPSNTVQCAGPSKIYSDVSIEVLVKLNTTKVCAAIWTRFIVDTGHRVTLCADSVGISTDYNGDIRQLTAAALNTVPRQHWRHTKIQLYGSTVVITIDGEQKINASLPAPKPAAGKVMLGLVNDDRVNGAIAEGQVAFADLEVRPLVGPRMS